MVDDGTGKLEIWRIENFELQPVEQDTYGQFFAGDCYVILYTYLVNSKENYIIYFWLGQVGVVLWPTVLKPVQMYTNLIVFIRSPAKMSVPLLLCMLFI